MAVDTAGIPLSRQFNSVSGLTHRNWEVKHCNQSKHLYRSGTRSLTFNNKYFDFKTPIVTQCYLKVPQEPFSYQLQSFQQVLYGIDRTHNVLLWELEMSDTACVYLVFVEVIKRNGGKNIHVHGHWWWNVIVGSAEEKPLISVLKLPISVHFDIVHFQLKRIISRHSIIKSCVSKGKSQEHHMETLHNTFLLKIQSQLPLLLSNKTKWCKLHLSGITNWRKKKQRNKNKQ